VRGERRRSPNLGAVTLDEQTVNSVKNRSLEEHYVAYLKEVASGRENLEEATNIGFQYQVAKAQRFWARVSFWVAVASLGVAIAAVVVASMKIK
jgi:hypothetical protein